MVWMVGDWEVDFWFARHSTEIVQAISSFHRDRFLQGAEK